MNNRKDDLDPLPYSDEIPSLMSSWGRVDIHSIAAKFLSNNKITGDYFEFGVGKGRSAVSAIRAYKRDNICSSFFLFDSFCGLPLLQGIDEDSIQFRAGDYAFTQESVLEFIKSYSITLDSSIQLIPGWFEKSLSDWLSHHCGVEAAVVHVDVDLFSSCTIVLNNIMPLLQMGTVILFDDWNCFKSSSKHGERGAVSAWLERNPGIQLTPFCAYGWHGQSFIFEK